MTERHPSSIDSIPSILGGLVYSHDLQTCDWPRNVACKTVSTNNIQDSSNDINTDTIDDSLSLVLESKKVSLFGYLKSGSYFVMKC